MQPLLAGLIFTLCSGSVHGVWKDDAEYNCCLSPGEGNPFVQKVCGEHGYGWRWSTKEYTDPAHYVMRDNRSVVLMLACIGVYLIALPISLQLWGRRQYFDSMVWLVSGWSSFFYHLSDALRSQTFGMTPLNWMRFTNVMACMLVSTEFIHTMETLQSRLRVVRIGGAKLRNRTLRNKIYYDTLRFGFLPIFLFLHECYLWTWWKGYAGSVGVTFAALLLLAVAVFKDNELFSLMFQRMVSFISYFAVGMLLIVFFRGQHGTYAYSEAAGDVGDSDLHRVWYGSWSLLSLCCLNTVALSPSEHAEAGSPRSARLRPPPPVDDENQLHKSSSTWRSCGFRRSYGLTTGVLLVIVALWMPCTPHLDPGRVKRWCCVVPPDSAFGRTLDPYVHGGCGSNGWRWKGSAVSLGVDWDNHNVVLMILTTVVTNASGLPVLRFFWKNHNPFSFVVGMWTMLFSALYHLADSVESHVFELSPGSWHRLDNVFAILSFVSLVVNLVSPFWSPEITQLVHTALVILTLYLQELGPWKIECTLVPVVAAIAIAAHTFHRTLGWTHGKRFMENQSFKSGLLFMGVAVTCFVVALDEDNDPVRAVHGCWHLFAGLGIYYLSVGSHEVGKAINSTLVKQA